MNVVYRSSSNVISCAVMTSLLFFSAAHAVAQSNIVQIEEHWELSIGEPDTQLSAPQATMAMSPQADLDGQYFLFSINHRNVPDYEPGGLQVQLWDADDAIATESLNAGPIDQSNDTIRWVQRLKVEAGTLSFEVNDGSSSSWGSFSGEESLALSTPTSLVNLNAYRPAISLGESQVGYAGNRVRHLLLSKLVWVTDDGQTHELHAPIDIDTGLDP